MKNRVLAVDADNTEFRCCGGNCPDNFINYQLCLVRCKGPDCFIHDDDGDGIDSCNGRDCDWDGKGLTLEELDALGI